MAILDREEEKVEPQVQPPNRIEQPPANMFEQKKMNGPMDVGVGMFGQVLGDVVRLQDPQAALRQQYKQSLAAATRGSRMTQRNKQISDRIGALNGALLESVAELPKTGGSQGWVSSAAIREKAASIGPSRKASVYGDAAVLSERMERDVVSGRSVRDGDREGLQMLMAFADMDDDNGSMI